MFDHVPVLLAETLASLPPEKSALAEIAARQAPFTFVDCTLGGAGHASALLEHLHTALPAGKPMRIVAFDRDASAREAAGARLTILREHLIGLGRPLEITIHPENFASAGSRLLAAGLEFGVDLLLADFGVSSPQLDLAERGFSLQRSGPLDMRMDPGEPLTARAVLETYGQRELERLLFEFGEEPRARKLAAAICSDRAIGTLPLSNTVEFASWCARVLGYRNSRVHPATRVFQALRMEVNRELEAIESLLDHIPRLISPCGQAGFITFHSLEDRPVKRRMRAWEKAQAEADGGRDHDRPLLPWEESRSWGKEVPRGGLVATDSENRSNPRARSARLRVFRFGGSKDREAVSQALSSRR